MDAPPPKTPNAKLNQQKRPQDESPDTSNTSKKGRGELYGRQTPFV
ncbi:hypothetical protein HanPSC8_Chr09g0350231 [Helianthus annuus]|nr:hypothetical protein HanPSC8_Chr09g0350231 [Helianthus annuus]